jgi:hypothetical protein
LLKTSRLPFGSFLDGLRAVSFHSAFFYAAWNIMALDDAAGTGKITA